MTVYKIFDYYDKHDVHRYYVLPCDLFTYVKWYGLKVLKNCYLSRRRAEKKAQLLNTTITIV